MKKIVLSLSIITILCTSLNAQSGNPKSGNEFKLDVGPLGSLPIGQFSKENDFGFGGFVKGAYGITSNIDATLHVSFTTYPGKSDGGLKLANLHLFNVLAGASYNFAGGLHADAGIGFCLSSGDPGFQYRIGAGYLLLNNIIDITVNFNGLRAAQETLNYIGVGISYRILGR